MSTAQRVVWGETVAELASRDERLVVLDGDLATSTRADIIAAAHPEQFIEVGIAEQNMIGLAVGLSSLGYRPWVSTFGVFITQRSLDQVRMLVSQMKSPVRLAAAYTGLLNGSSGKTHQDIEDLAIMRAMPGMTVIAPADAVEARAATIWASDHDGPVYLRLARDAVADVFDESYTFSPGIPRLLRTASTERAVVSTGVQTSRTAQALDALAGTGIAATHIHLPTLKPLDEGLLLHMLAGAKTIVTVEEHSVLGGLGGLVSEVVAGAGHPATVHRIGLADQWSESAPNDFLLRKYGLSAEALTESIGRIARQDDGAQR